MTSETSTGNSLLALAGWIALGAVLATTAYMAGAGLARRWAQPSLALPNPTEVSTTPSASRDAAWISAGEPVESSLKEDGIDRWQFDGRAGQSVTIETWLHPGSGSSTDAELVVRLIGPDGLTLTQESGSVFLPPYLFQSSLPNEGLYQVEVLPESGAPGRYSLALTFSDPLASATPGTEALPRVTMTPYDGQVAEVDPEEFQWPSKRRAISGWTFHDPRNPGHIGLDIAAQMYDPIVSVAEGIVVFAEWGGGYGNLVIVQHGSDWLSYYAHLSEIVVDVGQKVRQGELLGGAGSTGYSTGPHLHFELRYRDRPVDPHIHLP
jgi:hypothetical protein